MCLIYCVFSFLSIIVVNIDKPFRVSQKSRMEKRERLSERFKQPYAEEKKECDVRSHRFPQLMRLRLAEFYIRPKILTFVFQERTDFAATRWRWLLLYSSALPGILCIARVGNTRQYLVAAFIITAALTFLSFETNSKYWWVPQIDSGLTHHLSCFPV